jgi:formate dehydrogenase major subunit
MNGPVSFFLDGKEVSASPGETIWQVAKRQGLTITHLCHKDTPGYHATGSCRACVVEVEGERALSASCVRRPEAGMKVSTDSKRAVRSRKMVLELLLADHAQETSSADTSHFQVTTRREDVLGSRFAPSLLPLATDKSHPAFSFNPSLCIHCGLCVRACREVQANDVIGLSARGARTKIVFDFDDPLDTSHCVACGECLQACPTNALFSNTPKETPDKIVKTLCPYCGVGCQTALSVKDNKIIHVDGRLGPANQGMLCVKGRFGMDYVNHPHRLTKPLIRKNPSSKDADLSSIDPGRPLSHFREASWDEALDHAAKGFLKIIEESGDGFLAGIGSAKASNEEGYLFQKLIRTGLHTHNVDHCARLCHSASVSALMEGIGSGAVSAPFTDCALSDVIIVIGCNPNTNHPVASSFIKNAARKNARLIVIDPTGQALQRDAEISVRNKPGSDVALLNAVMNVIVEEGLENRVFIEARTSDFAAFCDNLKAFTPEAMAPKCGVDAATIRAIAQAYATAERAMIFWGMGITQHVHGTNNARCLSALALMCGQIGRPGTGLHPLRGQNNVQGASDVGILPAFLPGYQKVNDDGARAKFEELWRSPLPKEPGITVVEMVHAALKDEIKGMFIMGENPAMSDPDIQTVRKGLASLEHLVVQEIFLTETAMLADVVLPATAHPEKTGTFTNTNRQVQLGRKALDAPGDARQDWWILQELARRLGLDWDYSGPSEIFEELRSCWPALEGISWSRLERCGSVTHPCSDETKPGKAVIMGDRFNTPDGLGKFVCVDVVSPDELPDQEYPLILTTGRLLEHWHTGAMSRRTKVLDELEPEAIAHLAPLDMSELEIVPGERISLSTRRGEIHLSARLDAGIPKGMVFVPFCFSEAPANALTNPVLDPLAKIPEYKFCAVKVTKTNL